VTAAKDGASGIFFHKKIRVPLTFTRKYIKISTKRKEKNKTTKNITMKKISNSQRLLNLKIALQWLQFEAQLPDFFGIWKGDTGCIFPCFKEGVEINQSYMFGYLSAMPMPYSMSSERTYISVDLLGLAEFTDPFLSGEPLADSFHQTYDQYGSACEDTQGECYIQYCKESVSEESLLEPLYKGCEQILGTWEGLGKDNLHGIFFIVKNDGSQEYKFLVESFKKKFLKELGV